MDNTQTKKANFTTKAKFPSFQTDNILNSLSVVNIASEGEPGTDMCLYKRVSLDDDGFPRGVPKQHYLPLDNIAELGKQLIAFDEILRDNPQK